MDSLIRDPIEYAREIVGKDPMATFLGIRVEEIRKHYARCSLTIRPEFLNAVERAHGIAVYSIIDQALAVASNSTGTLALALSVNVNYIAGALDGERIFAEAVPVNVSNRICVWRVDVRGNEERLIASAEGITYHK